MHVRDELMHLRCRRSGFISRNEFADTIKLILYGENGSGDVNDAYVEELTSAMDFDKNGKIDFNEFLGEWPTALIPSGSMTNASCYSV